MGLLDFGGACKLTEDVYYFILLYYICSCLLARAEMAVF
jgi:hypothetical protein